ncbi:MAG: TonB-dependent receptor [bacterium]|nr:TonB-dependent receptor [bacterium]
MQVKHIDAVHIPIVINPMPLYPVSGLTKDDIEVLNTDDVAGLAAKVPGATVRSYGGMGGLKTVSMRGLGGQHTAVIIDGFQVTNAQAGQMNLGQLQSEGLESADAGLQVHFRKLIPVSANFTGSYLQFGTFMGSHYGGKLKVKSAVRYGSFMRKEAYVQGERAIGNWSVAGFGKYRGAEGAYPFQYVNGSTQTDGIRGNNDYQDMHVGVKLSRIVNGDGNMRVIYRSSFMDQGLPGAVIFYNETADERMKTQDHRLMLDFTKNEYQSNYRLYFNAGANNMDYFDPTHLNATGYLHNTFLNLSMNGGYIHFKVYENVDLKWGGEQKVEALTGNRTTLGVPLRTSSYGLFGAKKMWGRLQAEGLAGVQLVVDNNGESQKTHVQFTPNAKLQYDLSENKPVRLEFLYKRNFRLPSFNELYFGEVGNSDLQPEIAHQFNLGYHWRLVQNYYKWQVDMNAQTFYNRVRNKIVAIPTKNLFIWSMQNVQEAQIYGAIGETRVVRHFGEDTRVELLANYTWQRVIDITQDAITYGHQVAYAPEHTANADIMFIRRGFSARISNNFVSGRYALNQNVPANYLDPFWTLDAAVGYKYTIKNKHKIGVQFNVRNLTNVSYAFIRSYVMPGRHYLLTLNYEIL